MRCSIVFGEYHRIIKEHLNNLPNSSSQIYVEQILSSIIESTHPYFIISTLIISIVYFLLATLTPMISTSLICLSLVLYLVVNYLVHITFFASCLVITLRRIASRRHCLSCHRLSADYFPQYNKSPNFIARWSNKFQSLFNIDSIYKAFIAAVLCLLSIVGVLFSVWFALSIDTRLFDEEFLPRDAQSLRSYMKSQVEDFSIGPMIIFTIPQSIDYNDQSIRLSMSSLLEQCQNESRTGEFKLFWLDHENIKTITEEKLPLELRITPFSHNDLIVTDTNNLSTIVASRFYCQYNSLQGKSSNCSIVSIQIE